MKRIFTVLLVCLLFVSGNALFASAQIIPEKELEITQEMVNGVTTTRISNIFSLRRNKVQRNSEIDLLEEYFKDTPNGFDLEMARESNHVVLQQQTFYAANDSGSWTDSEGYLTIYTTAYHRGYVASGNARYYVTGEIVFHKEFILRNEDQFIMNHSSNGAYYPNDFLFGTMKYHASLHNHSAYVPPTDSEEEVTKYLSPGYTNNYGICYKLTWPANEIHQNGAGGAQKVDIKNIYSNWSFLGGYNVIATNDTNVAVNYIHNENILGNNLSIGFGAYGFSVGLNIQGSNTPYYAEPILIYNM